eukprot:RCo003640
MLPGPNGWEARRGGGRVWNSVSERDCSCGDSPLPSEPTCISMCSGVLLPPSLPSVPLFLPFSFSLAAHSLIRSVDVLLFFRLRLSCLYYLFYHSFLSMECPLLSFLAVPFFPTGGVLTVTARLSMSLCDPFRALPSRDSPHHEYLVTPFTPTPYLPIQPLPFPFHPHSPFSLSRLLPSYTLYVSPPSSKHKPTHAHTHIHMRASARSQKAPCVHTWWHPLLREHRPRPLFLVLFQSVEAPGEGEEPPPAPLSFVKVVESTAMLLAGTGSGVRRGSEPFVGTLFGLPHSFFKCCGHCCVLPTANLLHFSPFTPSLTYSVPLPSCARLPPGELLPHSHTYLRDCGPGKSRRFLPFLRASFHSVPFIFPSFILFFMHCAACPEL